VLSKFRGMFARQRPRIKNHDAGAIDIAREFETRGPWVTKFVIDGVSYGGAFNAMEDVRLVQFKEHFADARTVLELGSLEGGHSFGLAKYSDIDQILAIEGRAMNVERARFVGKLLEIEKVRFVEANLEDIDLADYGKFDAIFCSGLLYHLPEPWRLTAQAARVSPRLFIWTHYASDTDTLVVNGFNGKWYQESGLLDPLSGLSQESFWPTLDSLKDMLVQSGYRTVRVVQDQPQHPHGPAVTLAAQA
jgi:SAM-dependent methyltransferase